MPESSEHDKKVWEAAVVKLRFPAADITNATTSNPIFTAFMWAGVLFIYEVNIERVCGVRVFSSFTGYQRLDGLTRFDMIYLLTAIGLSPGGSSTVHIYLQTVHRTTQNKQYTEQHNNLGECGPCLVLASYTLAFALQLRKKYGKTQFG